MGRSNAEAWQSALWICGSFSLPLVLAGCIYGGTKLFRVAQAQTAQSNDSLACQTIIADPNPPLNVRSTPKVTPDNQITSLPNGTLLTVTDENNGWLKIDTPVEGWVYKELTVTSCSGLTDVTHGALFPTLQEKNEVNGVKLLAIAMEQYQAGNLNGAIALAKSIPATSEAHQPAQAAILQWPRDWQTAESKYYTAQKALRDERWHDIIQAVNNYPNIRYWKEKMAPIVQRAIEKHYAQP